MEILRTEVSALGRESVNSPLGFLMYCRLAKISGKISDDRFARMSKKYEEEQAEVAEKIKTAKAALDKSNSQSVTADMFISTVRKYTRAKQLTAKMLNELIQYIEVDQAQKIDGVWEQKLTIHYNCIGVIDIPDVLPIPNTEVSINTRKGVIVNYVPNTDVG